MPNGKRSVTWSDVRENPQLHSALRSDDGLATLDWHRAAANPMSSQVFCVSAFGRLAQLPADVRDAVVARLIGTDRGAQVRGPWSVTLEHSDPFVLDEHGGHATAIDAFLSSPTGVVAIESKFLVDAAQGFGGCSQHERGLCAGFFGAGSATPAFAAAARCVLEVDFPGRSRTARRYWTLAPFYFRKEVLVQQRPGDECPFRNGNFQLMRNFLYAAMLAHYRGTTEFWVLAMSPERTSGAAREQVTEFQEVVLQARFRERLRFLPYERLVSALRETAYGDALELADFLESRISTISSRPTVSAVAGLSRVQPAKAPSATGRSMAAHRVIPVPPAIFEGSLHDLYQLHIEPILPDVDVVVDFHKALDEYVRTEQPLFLVRYLRGMQRGATLEVSGGLIRPTDNSPAWTVHRWLFDRAPLRNAEELASFLEEFVPSHFHSMARIPSVSRSGWHVAHIFPAKDGNTSYQSWDRAELTKRFVRNLHPCNCFYVPKTAWHRYGGDTDVLAFAADVYRKRYGAIWAEFLRLAAAEDLPPPEASPDRFRDSYGPAQPQRLQPVAVAGSTPAAVEYSATRLMFRRPVIESLRPEQRFRIVTRDHGTFEMSRAEFEQVFDNIVKSVSWQRDGLYHVARPPAKAMRFRVGRS